MDSSKRRGLALVCGLVFACVCAGLFAGCGSEPPAPGNLIVSSVPPGADITIDGKATGKITPHTFEDLDGGISYTVSVAAENFIVEPEERVVEVPFGSTARTAFTLSSTLGSLSVTSEPAGADITLDGVATGEVTPYTFEDLDGGVTYTVSVAKDDFVALPAELAVEVPYGGSAEADFTLLSTLGSLVVTSEPDDAAITLNGVATGEVTPHTFGGLEGGTTYTVSVAIAGWAVFPAELSVEVPHGGSVGATFTLSQEVGSLAVTANQIGARILLNDIDTGEVTPHTFDALIPGDYTVTVEMDDHFSQPAEIPVTVVDGGVAAADFTLLPLGSLEVTSNPAGAQIFIDGGSDGEVTPHIFTGLMPGNYTVSVEMTIHTSQPALIVAAVEGGLTATADFTLNLVDIPRVVLLEGFSNVYCVGCPAMNANVEFVQHQPSYGPDRVLYVKWPAILSPLDPFYWVTTAITNARVSWYFGSSQINLPTLAGDGAVLGGLGTPVDANGMMAFIDGQPELADFVILVDTDEELDDVDDLTHQATVTLISGGIDLSDYHLNVVLVYEVVETENEGYIEGIQEYHWVMRDHVQPSTNLGVLTAGVSYPFDITLSDPLGGELEGHAVYPENKQIIAWVQHATSRIVLQAGSTVTTTTPLPNLPTLANPDARTVQLGGSR